MKREAAVGRLTTVNLLDELDVADRRRDPVADEIVSDVEEPVDLGVSIFLLIEKGRTQGSVFLARWPGRYPLALMRIGFEPASGPTLLT